MSKAGKFVKKHPWETAGMAAAAALGGPAALSLLGGGTAASGIAGAGAGLLGASEATAALAGDAFMPAALGAGGGGTPGMGSLLGSKFASGAMGGTLKNMSAGAKAAGLLAPPPTQGMTPMAPPPPAQPVAATNTIPQDIPPEIARDPKLLEMYLRRKQGGYA